MSTAATDNQLFYGSHIRAIRNRMTGSFFELLIDATINPGMIKYLDNHLSFGPNSYLGSRGKGNLNENLGREILELHTLSPAAGYLQGDVVEMALALSGWRFYAGKETNPDNSIEQSLYGTYFFRDGHEPGLRKIMGRTYKQKGDGSNQIGEILRDFAAHPATAQNIAFKLARHFIADVPPEASVNKIKSAFIDSKGDLITVHTAVIGEVIAHGLDNPKFTTPQNWLFQAYRLTGAPVPSRKLKWGEDSMFFTFRKMGQPFDECLQPNGWSDLKQDWISKELLDRRIRQASLLGHQTDASIVAALGDYADRLAGKGSDLATGVRRAETSAYAVAQLLCSPQFLKI